LNEEKNVEDSTKNYSRILSKNSKYPLNMPCNRIF